MAKYMYGNNGEKWKYLADEEPVLYSGAYRNFVAETPVKNTGASAGTGRKTVTNTLTAALPTSDYSSDEAERQMKIAAINASKNKELKLLGQNYSALINEAKQNNLDNLRQIYIAYMQGLQGIPQQQALWGAGGEIESLKTRSRLNYENNRSQENKNYSNTLMDIQQKYNDDLRALEQIYLKEMLSL